MRHSFELTPKAMEAIKLKAHILRDGTIEWAEVPPHLPAGDAEVILLYSSAVPEEESAAQVNKAAAVEIWPVLKGGRWKGDNLRREDIYDNDGR